MWLLYVSNSPSVESANKRQDSLYYHISHHHQMGHPCRIDRCDGGQRPSFRLAAGAKRETIARCAVAASSQSTLEYRCDRVLICKRYTMMTSCTIRGSSPLHLSRRQMLLLQCGGFAEFWAFPRTIGGRLLPQG